MLISDSWDIGGCIPNILLQCDAAPQYAIQNLRLINDWSCERDDNLEKAAAPVGLEKFTSLQSFCWIGIRSKVEFQLLGACLKANRRKFQGLTLDLTSWELANENWHEEAVRSWEVDDYEKRIAARSPNFFVGKILGIAPRTYHVFFEKLQNLSLSYVSFATMASEMASALDLGNLNTLVL